MLHVNHRGGFTIAVSDNHYITPIARRSTLSDDTLSPLIPVLEDIIGVSDQASIRAFFEPLGLQIQEWSKARTDRLVIRQSGFITDDLAKETFNE